MRDTERKDGRHGRCWERGASAQAGFSLIEVLISVFLVGTVILALAVGMLTMMRSTSAVSEQQRLEAAVLSFSEWLKTQEYVPCAAPGAYAAWSSPPGVAGEIVAVRHWQRGPDEPMDENGFAGACSTDLGRQLLDLTVRLDDGPDTTAQVVLRDDA